ncbi:MAG: hypothetical protein ABIE84_00345 [bacterium]
MAVYFNRQANAYGLGANIWYHGLRLLRRKDVSLKEIIGFRHHQTSVAAVGGNSAGELLEPTADEILYFMDVVLTHGNGPQVGRLLARHPEKTLNECVRMTQEGTGLSVEDLNECVGEALKAKLTAKLAARGKKDVQVIIVPTEVIVSADDPAFASPTKPIGDFYSWEELEAIGSIEERGPGLYFLPNKGQDGWYVKKIIGAKDSARPFRRVVASPKPVEIRREHLEQIVMETEKGNIVIACGGGGVPMVKQTDGSLKPVEAVIDKDLASALLAINIKARELIISTGVRRVVHNYGTPQAMEFDYYMVGSALQALREGYFPAGSMGEKVEAIINVLRRGVNCGMITQPNNLWIKFDGTLFTRGWDVMGRLFNAGRILGNMVEKVTGWRPEFLPKNELQRWLVK